jgi:dTDP-4-dehydrorhamnose reductase
VDVTGTGFRRPVREGPWRQRVLDVSSPTAVAGAVEAERAGAVLYLSYDKADRAVTVDGAVAAARAAARLGARFLLVSTDLVFDGATGGYSEAAVPSPVMPYGSLKVEAEGLVRVAHAEAVILRPALMAGESGAIMRPAYECGQLTLGLPAELYTDEWRSPVFVDDVARACWELIAMELGGTFHLGGPQRMTRFELGELLCRAFGFDPALLRPATRPADRPRDTSLDSSRLIGLLDWAPQSLEQALRPALTL